MSAENRPQALEFEIDGAEQLRMPRCVSIADYHEHGKLCRGRAGEVPHTNSSEAVGKPTG